MALEITNYYFSTVEQEVKRIRQWWKEHPDEDLYLSVNYLQRADLHGADLHGADLHGADLQGANLQDANLYGADLHGARLQGARLQGAELLTANLQGAELQHANLQDANLIRADLQGANLREANLQRARLQGANLQEANLREANLQEANLREANLQRANLREANLSGTNLDAIQNVYRAYSLETVQLRQDETSNIEDALYFETCQRPWPERWLDWERLRVVGRLPLFGASYTALILIPILFYGLARYSELVMLMRAWAEQVMTQPDHLLVRLASLILTHLHPPPIPQQSLLLFISTILLAVGSTLYTGFCPSRIKEFSRDQWCDQLGHSLLHYWPFAWKHRYIRLVCTACYALGGVGAFWVLGTKLWRVFVFIFKYSPYPWPWR